MLSQNQLAQSPIQGQVDLKFNGDTISVQIDDGETAELVPGQAVKIVDSAGGVPKVEACAADTDDVLGYLIFNGKNKVYKAGDAAEIAIAGSAIYLQASAAIARGAQVCSDVVFNTDQTGVKPVAAGSCLVGWAIDKAAAQGDLIRVMLTTPSHATY